jgi:hypothetical protein
MEITQKLQPVQDKVEGQGVDLEQVATTAEQRLEGPTNDAVIQEFIEHEVLA